MKIYNNKIKRSFTTSTNKNITVKHEVSPDVRKKLISILIHTLYESKETSCFREILSNAIDANRLSKQLRIDINIDIAKTVIRDYGPGLTEEEVGDVFCRFFYSTKDESDDFIGGFGLGAKTPLLFSDHFFVTSYKDGFKSTYKIWLTDDHDNILYEKLSYEETQEPNGIEVHIPVSCSVDLIKEIIDNLYYFNDNYKYMKEIYICNKPYYVSPKSVLFHIKVDDNDVYVTSNHHSYYYDTDVYISGIHLKTSVELDKCPFSMIILASYKSFRINASRESVINLKESAKKVIDKTLSIINSNDFYKQIIELLMKKVIVSSKSYDGKYNTTHLSMTELLQSCLQDGKTIILVDNSERSDMEVSYIFRSVTRKFKYLNNNYYIILCSDLDKLRSIKENLKRCNLLEFVHEHKIKPTKNKDSESSTRKTRNEGNIYYNVSFTVYYVKDNILTSKKYRKSLSVKQIKRIIENLNNKDLHLTIVTSNDSLSYVCKLKIVVNNNFFIKYDSGRVLPKWIILYPSPYKKYYIHNDVYDNLDYVLRRISYTTFYYYREKHCEEIYNKYRNLLNSYNIYLLTSDYEEIRDILVKEYLTNEISLMELKEGGYIDIDESKIDDALQDKKAIDSITTLLELHSIIRDSQSLNTIKHIIKTITMKKAG